jgi:tRNA (cmo5U34)-methyltransferase
MTISSDPGGGHDWQSPACVDDWIDSDVTHDEQRQPLLHRVATLLPATGSGPLEVLDVGGGYGVLTAAILEDLPDATVVLHDYSEAMINKAKERLSRFGDRVRYRIADMTQPGWTDKLSGPFDAVASALAIHNLEPEQIQRVYRDIFSLLRPGGCLLNLDVIFPASAGLADLYRRDPSRDPTFDVSVAPAGLEEQPRWLRAAGFAEVDCVWKELDEGLLWGLRAA